MATTGWIGSTTSTHGIPDVGDWANPADWTNGVPTATVDAVFPSDRAAGINGDGPAASLTVEKEQTQPGGTTAIYSLGGTHAPGTLVVAPGAELVLGQTLPPFDMRQGVPGLLSVGSALVSGDIDLTFGSRLDAGTITLAGGSIGGVTGTLSSPVVLTGNPGSTGSIVSGSALDAGNTSVLTITSPISGGGTLDLVGPSFGQGRLVLAGTANTATGGIVVQGTVEAATPGCLGTGPVSLLGSLTLDAGVTAGPIIGGVVTAVDASLTVFGAGSLANGSGSSSSWARP